MRPAGTTQHLGPLFLPLPKRKNKIPPAPPFSRKMRVFFSEMNQFPQEAAGTSNGFGDVRDAACGGS